jgi:hypothetical protein
MLWGGAQRALSQFRGALAARHARLPATIRALSVNHELRTIIRNHISTTGNRSYQVPRSVFPPSWVHAEFRAGLSAVLSVTKLL